MSGRTTNAVPTHLRSAAALRLSANIVRMMKASSRGRRGRRGGTDLFTRPPPSSTTKDSCSRNAFLRGTAAIFPLVVGASRAVADNEMVEKMIADKIASGWQEPEVTERGFMDITISGKPAGRLVINLYGKVVPNTVRNFVALLTGKNNAGISYQGTEAYRVLEGLNIQMGAIGSRSGKSGISSTGENIPLENFEISHMKEGLLSMVKNGEAQGDSRFFISIKDDAGWADNRYVAFGRVAEGMAVVHQIERVKVEGGTNKPKKPVVIETCGLL